MATQFVPGTKLEGGTRYRQLLLLEGSGFPIHPPVNRLQSSVNRIEALIRTIESGFNQFPEVVNALVSAVHPAFQSDAPNDGADNGRGEEDEEGFRHIEDFFRRTSEMIRLEWVSDIEDALNRLRELRSTNLETHQQRLLVDAIAILQNALDDNDRRLKRELESRRQAKAAGLL